MRIGELLGVALSVIWLALMVFSLGAQLAWAWAMKSLEVAPPWWIAAATGAAGAALVVSAALRSDWLTELTSGAMFTIIVAAQLRVGPWRRRSDGSGSA